jgi:L-aspartate oxidase
MEEDDALRGASIERAKPWQEQNAQAAMEYVVIDHDWDEARRIMWDYVGIVRNDERLHIALERMLQVKQTIESLYWKSHPTQDLLELRNIVLVGELVIRSAQLRRESRGLHFTESCPERDDSNHTSDTILALGEQ